MKVELAKRAFEELQDMDEITSALISGWIRRHLIPLQNPKSLGSSLGGTKRWQYRIGDYRLLARVSEKRIIILAITHGHTLPSRRSWMIPKSIKDIEL